MAEVAKFKLITTKGVVLAGEPLPDGIQKKELDGIRDAGGLEGSSGRKVADPDAAKAATIAAAEKKVDEAKDAIIAAGTDTVALDKAKIDLANAEAELLNLKG